MYAQTKYSSEQVNSNGFYKITFIVNATGELLTRSFDSEYYARIFANKLRYSKKCTLISRPNFS